MEKRPPTPFASGGLGEGCAYMELDIDDLIFGDQDPGPSGR